MTYEELKSRVINVTFCNVKDVNDEEVKNVD